MKELFAKMIRFFERCSNVILTKPLFRALFCFLLCALFYTFVFCIYPIRLDTNDDGGIMYITAGYLTGTPNPHLPAFSSFFLGYIISGLYRLFPAFPCYAIFYITTMFVSCVIILYCIIETANRYNTSLAVSTLFCMLFLCVFALRPIILIQYTTVAAFSGGAAIALAVTSEPSIKRYGIMRYVAIAILWLFSYIIRVEVFIPTAVMLCGIFIFKFLENKKTAAAFASVILFVIVSIAADKGIRAYAEKDPVWAEYNEFYKLGSIGENIQYQELLSAEEMGIELYEKYSMIAWCYLVEHMNTEFLSNSIELAKSKIERESLLSKANSALNILLPFFKDRYSGFLYFLLLAMFITAIVFQYIKSARKKHKNALAAFCISNKLLIFVFLMFHCFIAYLCLFRGRFPERVQYMLMLLVAPFIIINVCVLCGKLVKKVYFFMIFALIACNVFGMNQFNITELRAKKNWLEGTKSATEKIVLSNPNLFFISDGSLTTPIPSLFTVFGRKRPVNLMFWGGWFYFTPMWYEQLRCNGIDKLDYNSFLEDNVLLMSAWNLNENYLYNPFFSYMVSKFSEKNGFFNVIGEFPYDYGIIYIYKFFTAMEYDNET